MQAYSGIHTSLVELLAALINKNIIPCIYEHGGVGASGDLVQLAHLGLNLIGEGKVWFESKWQETAAVFEKTGLKPLEIQIREGLVGNQRHFSHDRHRPGQYLFRQKNYSPGL